MIDTCHCGDLLIHLQDVVNLRQLHGNLFLIAVSMTHMALILSIQSGTLQCGVCEFLIWSESSAEVCLLERTLRVG